MLVSREIMMFWLTCVELNSVYFQKPMKYHIFQNMRVFFQMACIDNEETIMHFDVIFVYQKWGNMHYHLVTRSLDFFIDL